MSIRTSIGPQHQALELRAGRWPLHRPGSAIGQRLSSRGLDSVLGRVAVHLVEQGCCVALLFQIRDDLFQGGDAGHLEAEFFAYFLDR